MKEALAHLLTGEAQNLIQGPCRAGTRSQIEFDAVFVGVEPLIQKKGFQLHVSPRRTGPAKRRTSSIQVYRNRPPPNSRPCGVKTTSSLPIARLSNTLDRHHSRKAERGRPIGPS